MKFIYHNQEYRISFEHLSQTRGQGKKQRISRQTVCRIRTGERDTASEQVVATATVSLFYKDQFKKEAARQASLIKSLKEFDRPFRKAAGDAYRLRSRTNPSPSVRTIGATS